jgi:hypothetical protein
MKCMQQVNPSEVIKKIFKVYQKPIFFGLFLLVIIVASFYSLHITNGRIFPFYVKLLSSFPYAVTILVAISLGLYNYIDNVCKDVLGIENANHNSLKKAVYALTALKKEILVNVALIFCLLVVQYLMDGLLSLFDITNPDFKIYEWVAISFRLSCFAILIYAAYEQISSFIIANEYRSALLQPKK